VYHAAESVTYNYAKTHTIMSGKSDSVIREAEAVIDHLYETTELEKLVWARELHDEIGGLMVSA
jgi:hypothetical protein